MKTYVNSSHFVGLVDGILCSVIILIVGYLSQISISYLNKTFQIVLILTLIAYFLFSSLINKFIKIMKLEHEAFPETINSFCQCLLLTLFDYFNGYFCGILLIGIVYFNTVGFIN